MTSIVHTVTLGKLDPTLDEMQEFIDEAKGMGIDGSVKISVVGKNSGYHFTGTYQFSPNSLRVRSDGARKCKNTVPYDGPGD